MSLTNIITSTILSTMLLASSFSNENSQFAYNVETGEKQEITSQTIYKVDRTGKYLSYHLKYNFGFDEQRRLSEKEVLKWDESTQEWENAYRLTYQYDPSEYSIKLSIWNNKTSAYKETSEKTVYSFGDVRNLAFYENYKLNEETKGWDLIVNHMITEFDKKLLANK